MRFLFTTIQFVEAEFFARVSEHLRDDRGHDVAHVAISRRAARAMATRGLDVRCLPELVREADPGNLQAEVARIESEYPVPSLRDVYRADPAVAGLGEGAAVERTVRHFLAMERVFDEVRPDVLVPDIGSETMRSVAQLVAARRGVDAILLFYTIFPNPLRMFVNTVQAPIVDPASLRELDDEERAEVEGFIAGFTARGKPTVPHRRARVTPAKLRDFARHLAVRGLYERDNEYLRPGQFVRNFAREKARAAAARSLYGELAPERPFVYFPLHVTDDFKVKKVIPHCVDQAYLVRQVADALPQGHDVVLKEHPLSIGRNSTRMLRSLAELPNVRLVEPHVSSHELIQRSAAVVVIGSTVGLEALLYAKPVLTLGRPFYAGFGVTVDIDSFAHIRTAVPGMLRFRPDRDRILSFLHAAMHATYPGAPAGVSATAENAATVAASLHDAAARAAGESADRRYTAHLA